MERKSTKKINVGGIEIGGGSAVTVQSMCNTKTWDVEATVARSAPVEKNFMEREKLSIKLMGFLMKAIGPLM